MEDNITDTEMERKRTGNGNLIPPVKGEVRNPNGRGKGVRNRSTIIREIVEAAAAEALKGRVDLGVQPQTIFDQIVLAQVIKASLGDTTAAAFLADSAYGKLTDKVNNTHSFKKMGNIVAVPVGEKLDATASPEVLASQPEAFALTFDIGEPASMPDGAVEEFDEEGDVVE